jgi:hypothetical protein
MKSEKLDLLATALSKAQAEMPAVPMNAVNPFLKNKYADLAEMIRVASPILSKNGLSISQQPVSFEGQLIGVTTTLLHTSGQWIEDTISLPLGDEKGKSLAQVAGSIITYLRRYSYGAIVGLATDEDTDGNAPAKRHEQPAVPCATGKMTLEMASSEVGGDKKRYGDCTTEALEHKKIGLTRVKTETPDKWTDDHQRKLDAVVTILESRASGSGA